MSTQTQPPKPQVPDGWRPQRREHGVLINVRRTKDGHRTFKGQEKDEEVKMVVRQHPIFLLRPALPVVLVILGFILNSFLVFSVRGLDALWTLTYLLLVIALIIALGYFLWRDFLVWWVNLDIITNKRIISCRGFLQPSRKVITLDKIVQLSVRQGSLLNMLFRYGDVHIYLVGGEHVLKDVTEPQEIRNALDGIYLDFKASRPVAEKPPQLVDPDMTNLIGKLGKKDAVPILPNADEHYLRWQRPERLRGPLRRFGGPLRIPITEITYASDEHTVMYIQRSIWLLRVRLIVPVLAVFVELILTFILSPYAPFMIIALLITLAVIGLIIINYVDDVFILTNKRVIDIERRYLFFQEVRVEVDYKNIRDSKAKIKNILQNLFDVGSVYLETAGNNPDIDLTMIDHPFFISDRVNQIKAFAEKVKIAKDKNMRQDELSKWFTYVVAELEKKMVSKGVPNLQTLDLWTATEMASEAGMKVVPIGEDDTYPHIQPGRIVSQEPIPGTQIVIGPQDPVPLIQVVLSKHS